MSALWIQIRVMKMQVAPTTTVLTTAHASKDSPVMEKPAKVNLLSVKDCPGMFRYLLL